MSGRNAKENYDSAEKKRKSRNSDMDKKPKKSRHSNRRSSSGSPYRRNKVRGTSREVHGRYWDDAKIPESKKNHASEFEVGKRYYDTSERVVSSKNVKKEEPDKKTKSTDMLNTRTGGAYIPPARLRMMQAEITDKSSPAYQRIAWEALKKSIHGHINKINVGNIAIIIKELLRENIVRGRGLLCRSIIQAQAASPTFSHVYAALVAAINSRFPNIGELLLKRLIIQFKRGFKRNDKSICISAATFIAHLVNQRVTHEILALELLTLLVENPTDDSIEVAIAFLKECGQKLTEVSAKGVNAIFDMLRNILHEGQLDKRVQYMIEVMAQIRKDGFKDHIAVMEELELVPEEEQFTHLVMLEEASDPQDLLNVFKLDEKYEENEQKYKDLCKEILGSDAESGLESQSGSDEESDDDDPESAPTAAIVDNTETNLIALRRTIYLTINSSLDFEECAHKLTKLQLKPGQEIELCHMFLDCCAEQRTYEKFYGLLAQRFCQMNKIYINPFEDIFKDSYATAHRLDTNRLRNVSKFFAHLLFTDSISWDVLECVKLNEEDTTSSSRIYIKILFQELAEYMGLRKLNERLQDVTLQESFTGIFPRDNPKNTRFAINFFTSIGLGGLTDELREHLKQIPKVQPTQQVSIQLESGSSDSESSSSESSTSSSSDSSSDSSSEDSNQENHKEKEKHFSRRSDNKIKDSTTYGKATKEHRKKCEDTNKSHYSRDKNNKAKNVDPNHNQDQKDDNDHSLYREKSKSKTTHQQSKDHRRSPHRRSEKYNYNHDSRERKTKK